MNSNAKHLLKIISLQSAVCLSFFFILTLSAYAEEKVLILPKSQAKLKDSSVKQAPLPDTVPGSIPDILNQLKMLNEKLNQFESYFTAKLNRLEMSYAELKNDYLKFKQGSQKPQCSSDQRYSVNPSNNSKEDCAPYACNPVTGLCRNNCVKTGEQCATGVAVCDRGKEKCVWATDR